MILTFNKREAFVSIECISLRVSMFDVNLLIYTVVLLYVILFPHGVSVAVQPTRL